MAIKSKIGLSAREDDNYTQAEIEKMKQGPNTTGRVTYTLPDSTKEAHDQMMKNYQDELTEAQPKRRQIWNAASDQGLAEIERQGRIRQREEEAFQDAKKRSQNYYEGRKKGDGSSWWNPLGVLTGIGEALYGSKRYNPETRQFENVAPTSWKEATQNILRNVANTASGLSVSGNGKGGVVTSFNSANPNRWRALWMKNEYAPHEAWENAQDQLLQQSLDPHGIQPLRPWTFDADYPTAKHPMEPLMLQRAADEEDFREKKAQLDRVSEMNGWGDNSPERQRYMEYLFNVTPTEEQEGDRAAAAVLKAGGTEEEASEARQNVIRAKFNLKTPVSKQAAEFKQALIDAGITEEEATKAAQEYIYATKNQDAPIQVRALMFKQALIAAGETEDNAQKAMIDFIYTANNQDTPEEKEANLAAKLRTGAGSRTSGQTAKNKVAEWRVAVPRLLADPTADPELIKKTYQEIAAAVNDQVYEPYVDTTYDSKGNELTGIQVLADDLLARITEKNEAPPVIAEQVGKFAANTAAASEVARQENIAIAKEATEKVLDARETTTGADGSEWTDVLASVEKNAPHVQMINRIIDDLADEYTAHKQAYDSRPALLRQEIMRRLEGTLKPLEFTTLMAVAQDGGGFGFTDISKNPVMATALLLLYRKTDPAKAKTLERTLFLEGANRKAEAEEMKRLKTHDFVVPAPPPAPPQDINNSRVQLNFLTKPAME